MEEKITFTEDDGMYWFSREPHEEEGSIPVAVEFDSVFDFAKAMSENKEAKEFYKSALTVEKNRIKAIIDECGSIRNALDKYVKYTVEDDEEYYDIWCNLDPFEYFDYLFYMTNNRELLEKYSHYLSKGEHGKIAYGNMMDTAYEDFAKKYLAEGEYKEYLSNPKVGTELWYKYYEALLQDVLTFELK